MAKCFMINDDPKGLKRNTVIPALLTVYKPSKRRFSEITLKKPTKATLFALQSYSHMITEIPLLNKFAVHYYYIQFIAKLFSMTCELFL